MESAYTVMSLKNGEFHVPFSTIDNFANEIEERTGIFIIDQLYWASGMLLPIDKMVQVSERKIQVSKENQVSRRYYVTIPTGTVKVYLTNPDEKFVLDLFSVFLKVCKKHSLRFSIDEYGFFFNSRILELFDRMSEIPSESKIFLVSLKFYPRQLEKPGFYIFVKTIEGRSLTILTKRGDIIRNIKSRIQDLEGIPTSQQKLFFAGKHLENERTLEDYCIHSESTLRLLPEIVGGCNSYFYFNSMNSSKKIEFNSRAPRWRSVKPGVSWVGICINPKCVAFNHEVICNCGLGVFDVGKQIHITSCPMCNCKVNKVGGCGFFDCNYSFYGVLKNGEIKEGSGIAGCENYTSFFSGIKAEWQFMRIQVDSGKRPEYF